MSDMGIEMKYIMFGEIPNKSIRNIFYEELYPFVKDMFDIEMIPIESKEEERLVFKELDGSRTTLENRIQNSLENEFDRYPNTDIRRILGTHAIKEQGRYQIFGTGQSNFSRHFMNPKLIFPLIPRLGDEIVDFSNKVKNIFTRKNALFLTSHGTLDIGSDKLKELDSIRKLHNMCNGKLAIITGWDWKTKGVEIRKSYREIGVEPLAIYTEGGTKIYVKGKGEKTYEFVKNFTIAENLASSAHKYLIRSIYKTRPNAILRAQNNEIGYCYYIDVDSETVQKLNLPMGEKKKPAYIRKCLMMKDIEDIAINSKNKITINSIDNYTDDDLFEKIYRVMGSEMTFRPFRYEIDSNSIAIEMIEKDPDSPIKLVEKTINDDGISKTIQKIPDEIETIIYETIKMINQSQSNDKENLIKRIKAQTDICIDVFVQPKDFLAMTWDYQLNKLGLPKKTKITYLTKGTESDLPFLNHLYNWANSNKTSLEVVGHKNLPSEFRKKDYFRTAPNAETFYQVVNTIVSEESI